MAVGTVVRHRNVFRRNLTEFLFEDDQILIAEANDGMHLSAQLMQTLGQRIRDRAADAAADHRDLLQAVQRGGVAQRADEIGEALALLLLLQLIGRRADDLIDDADRAGPAAAVCDRQRNALAVRIDAQDDELPRLRLGGDQRRLDHHAGYGRIQ